MHSFQTTFTCGPILECLVLHLRIVGLRNLQLTCRQFAGLYEYSLPVKWKIDKYLSRWFSQPKKFRGALTEYNAVISGSAALHFLEGSTAAWTPSELDVYVCSGQPLRRMLSHLEDVQGYVRQGIKLHHDSIYRLNMIVSILTLQRTGPKAHQTVQLVVVGDRKSHSSEDIFREIAQDRAHDPIMEIITHFHSSLVVNYLTGDQAVSLYPLLTFVRRKIYLFQDEYMGVIMSTYIRKYRDGGWNFAELASSDWKKKHHPVRAARVVGDRMTWRISYGHEGVSHKPDGLSNDKQFWWCMRQGEFRSTSHNHVVITTMHSYIITFCGLLVGPKHNDVHAYRVLAPFSAATVLPWWYQSVDQWPCEGSFSGSAQCPFHEQNFHGQGYWCDNLDYLYLEWEGEMSLSEQKGKIRLAEQEGQDALELEIERCC